MDDDNQFDEEYMSKLEFPQKMVNMIARIVHHNVNCFEIMAPSCEHANGNGGCEKLSSAGYPQEACMPLSCPLGSK